jgi:hypothetical protein
MLGMSKFKGVMPVSTTAVGTPPKKWMMYAANSRACCTRRLRRISALTHKTMAMQSLMSTDARLIQATEE